MKPIKLTQENLDATMARSGVVMVNSWAPWCGGCKTFGPVFERVAARHLRHTFVTLDTSVEKDLATDLNIAHVPSLLVFRDGILLYQQPGNFGESDLEEILSRAESLEMDQVRIDIDESTVAEDP
ncbi:MAG: thioredoxin family protein [Candidatus Latescibacterota bacterium]|nr:MAG: thioredoxin family protein [Candidatus Latescibacterota bacterium]